MLNNRDSIAGVIAQDIMTKNPKTITSTTMVIDAFNMMEDFAITQLVVVDYGEFKGILHIHDILKEGIV
jgi:arabinose-5-phosphate isomerase